jgi:penicillin amidase
MLASANNRSAGSDYPYHISHWFTVPDRYNRILEMLSEKDVFDIEDMMKMQADQKSLWVRRVQAACWPILLEADLKGDALAAFDRVHAWDGDMDKDGIQSTLFEVFNLMLREMVFKDELGDHYPAYMSGGAVIRGVMDRIIQGQEISWCDDVGTPDTTESFTDLVVPAWNGAIEWLKINYGEDINGWVWGDLHTVSLKHPLASVEILNRVFRLERGPYRAGGSSHTVSPYNYRGFSSFSVNHGASQRHVYNLLDPDGSEVIMPSGVSGMPASDFFCNQTGMYMKNEYIGELFSREKVEQYARYRAVFSRR